MPMTPIESLRSVIRDSFPDFSVEIHYPTRDKPWQLICRALDEGGQPTAYQLVINWSSKRGFGINSDPRNMDPDEVYMELAQAQPRVLEMLQNRIVPVQARTRVVDRQ